MIECYKEHPQLVGGIITVFTFDEVSFDVPTKSTTSHLKTDFGIGSISNTAALTFRSAETLPFNDKDSL